MTRQETTILLAQLLGLVLLILPAGVSAYPLDGYATTGIRRLEAARLARTGARRGRRQPPGALLSTAHVDVRLQTYPDMRLPSPDPEFTAQIRTLLGDNAERYGLAVLDLSDPTQPRYAEHRADMRQNVGSVGKILVAVGLFQALADMYPDDLAARRRLLRDTIVTADAFINVDHHKVRLWNPATQKLTHRALRQGDRGTLWEYADWMLSASSNAAAAMVMKHLLLLVHYGKDYPVSEAEAARFFAQTPRQELGALFEHAMHQPIRRNGLDLNHIRQGSFFTREGKRRVPGTSSYATSRALMQLLLRLEQGRLVDAFSSRELKRLLYMTERRIRYASAPALAKAAVYFKSGSLYQCEPEEGFTCKKYHGNVKNFMNSIAIIASPAGASRHVYLVTLLSNVLRKNSAVDHQTLATRIHRLIERAHPAPSAQRGNGQSTHPKAR